MKKRHLIGAALILLIISLVPFSVFAGEKADNTGKYLKVENIGNTVSVSSPKLSASVQKTFLEKGKTTKLSITLSEAVGKVSVSVSDKNIISLKTNYENSKQISNGTIYLWLDSEEYDGKATAEITLTGGNTLGNAKITVKTEDVATVSTSPKKYDTSSTLYVFNDNGSDGFIKKDGDWYYRKGGKMVTGLQKINGYWRYFDSSTYKMLTGLQKTNGYWRYFDLSNGRMLTGLQKTNGYWRYFDLSNGRMLTGLQKTNGYWRYFDLSNGRMLTGFQTMNGYKRYFDLSNGRMVTGLQKIDGEWYYFDLSNGRMLTGWQKVNGYKRYFNLSSGIMLTGEQEIDGKTYYFDEKGICKN